MSILWTSFASPDDGYPLELTALSRSVSYCDLSTAEPVLYLNDDVAGMQHLLDGKHLLLTNAGARISWVRGYRPR